MNNAQHSIARLRRLGLAASISLVFAYGLGEAPPARAAEGPPAAVSNAPPMTVERVARGRYLVSTSGCMDCHTPLKMGPQGPEPDMNRVLSGHPETLKIASAPVVPEGPWMMIASVTNTAFAGPWGVSFTANLTPDPETGLGRWTVDDFKATIRTGRHLGRGREILPPMPIPAYSNFSDPDLEAVFDYLRTLPPVKNHVPEPSAPSAAPVASR
jgi:mono/diheme cytochrome c family protein